MSTKIVFSDAQYWEEFLPLTFTKPVAEMRFGTLTFAERWKKLLNTSEIYYLSQDYLQEKFPAIKTGEVLFLVPNFLPTKKTLECIVALKCGEALVYKDELIATKIEIENFSLNAISKMTDIEEELIFISNPTDLFTYNEQAINFDFELLTKNRVSQKLSETNGLLGDSEDLFIEEGASVEFSTLNCKTGKIYIGKDSEVMEGCNLRGPVSLGDFSKFNLGAKIYGATTIGPHCKIGGEVNNIVVFGYSNKGHDGFLGNSVIGEWCNLGADTNSSNLKNNYAEVKLWNFKTKSYRKTGLQFAGVIMGDHSKTAINTQLNTGTVVGMAANIFKNGFPPNLVENFTWGGMKGDEKFRLEKAFEVAQMATSRRNIAFTEEDKRIMEFVYENY